MMWTRRTAEGRGLVLPLLALMAVGGSMLAAMASLRATVPRTEPVSAFAEPRRPGLARQLAAVNEAIARKDLTGAVLAWRDAYGLALGTRQWETMAAVGDAAVRIDAVAGGPSGRPTGFRAEARQAYLTALFRARAEGSRAGIERIAHAFADLGDADMASRARAIAVKR